MRRFPRTLIGFCAVHILEPGAAREVERCLAAGFKGVGELAWYETDLKEDLTAALAPIAELCAHYRAPLLVHTNDPVGPVYPGKAQKSAIEGSVDLEFTIAENGAVRDITVRAADPPGVFEQAAISALSQWRYQPVVRGAGPIVQRAHIRIRFALVR